MKRISIRLTEAEHESLVKGAARARLSANQYLLNLLYQKSVFDEIDKKQEARMHKLADTMLARLDMLEERIAKERNKP